MAGAVTASSATTCFCVFTLTILLTCLVNWPGQRISSSAQATYTDCGGWINDTKGYIHTPNFPHQFPVPIACKWVLHAPPGKKVVLYFTQYYMRESFQVSEYSHYSKEFYVSKTDLGEIDVFDREVLTSYNPFLVLDFKAHEIGIIHLRVHDFLLDVYGFNITYEIVDEQESVRQDVCTVLKCSFLGNCLATRNFESYRCYCFSGFYGDECEYGPQCDPDIGINMCRNGGKCRYFYGSLVNTCECPPGYVGAQCQNEQEGYVVDSVCEVSGCNQKCVQQNNGTSYRCECIEGFRLSADNKTCVEKGRMLFKAKITLKLDAPEETNLPVDDKQSGLLTPNACTRQRLKEELFNEVSRRFGPLLQDFLNLTLLGIQNTSDTIQIEFYFIGEKSERGQVWELLLEFIFDTTLCGRQLDANQIDFDPQPVLHSLTLQNSEKSPAVEGRKLSLVCKVRGSSGLRFEWFKDGAVVNVHQSERNMWQTRIPPNDGETHLSILNIEKAHRLDEGEYTCRVWDWNETDTKSIHIRVVPIAHIEISPLSGTVEANSSITISCLSWDDEQADFTYRWLRDGQEMNLRESLNQEMVEEMFPIGSRVELRRVTVSATYTCEVNSSAGTVRDHSKIAVILDPNSVCDAEDREGMQWPATAANETAVLDCPRDGAGRASRRCNCRSPHRCKWQEPTFVSCYSRDLELQLNKLEKLQLGYKLVEVEDVLEKLKEFSVQYPTHSPRLIGDLELLAKLLVYVHEHIQRYANSSDTHSTRLKDILELASMTLQSMDEANEEERNDMLVGHYLLRLFKSVAKDPSFTGTNDFQSSHIQTKAIDSMTSRIQLTKEAKGTYTLHSHHNVNISLDTSRVTLIAGTDKRTVTATTVVYNGLSELLTNVSPPVEGHSVNSRVAFVGFADYGNIPFFIHFKHHRRVSTSVTGLNGTHCAHWKSEEFPVGFWAIDSCEIAASSGNSTLCKCYWPGHYTIFSPSISQTEMSGHTDAHLISLVGCIVSLTLFIATLVTHAFFWIQMKDETRVVSINFSCIMILVNVCIIAGFTVTESKMACQIVKILLYWLYMAAFTFMLLEALKLYATSLGRTMGRCPLLKTLAAGWGLPALATIAVIVSASTAGHNAKSRHLCWITYREWEFYAFISPVFVIVLIYSILITGAIKSSMCVQPQNPKDGKRKYLFYICRSVLSVIYLLAVVIFSIILASSDQDTVYEYLFATSMVALGALNVLIRCLFHPSICSSQSQTSVCGPCGDLCLKMLYSSYKEQDQKQNEESKSFKAFVRPQTLTTEEDFADLEVTSKRDRIKYTKERKEQLQALLGSSGTDSSDSQQLSRASTVSSRLEDGEALVMGPLDNNQRPRHISSCPFKPARCRAFILDEPGSSTSQQEATKSSSSSSNSEKCDSGRLVIDKVPCLLAKDDDDDDDQVSKSSSEKSVSNPFPELNVSPRSTRL